MLARTCALIMMCLVGGCATAPARVPTGGLSRCADRSPCDGTVSLQVEAKVAGEDSFHPIAQNKVLHSGDLLMLTFEADRTVHVYAARVPHKGPPEVFFPAEGDRQAAPNVPLSIPGDGGSIRLDSIAGKEDLRVVVSVRLLDPAQIQQLLSEADRERVRDPPNNPKEKDRESHVVRGPLDERGTAVLRFVFQHR